MSAHRLYCVYPLCAAMLVGALATPAWSWGDRTHRFVTRLAVETLPADAAAFYGPHVEVLARRSVEPDSVMRARAGREEKVRHFINLDAHLPPPFTAFPRSYRGAVVRFGERRVERHGVLPWVILRFHRQLREAVAQRAGARVLREAAYLGHYVADAYQPLHLTRNFDGQLGDGAGVHRRVEDGLVDSNIDRYGAGARTLVQAARVLDDPRAAVFDALFESYDGVEVILNADRVARQEHGTDTSAYYAALDVRVATMCQRQMARAASMLGSLWLTAWQEGSRGAATTVAPGVLTPSRRVAN